MAASYQRALTEDARSYLSGRGIRQDAVESYRIGQADGSYIEHEDYTGMLSIPYLTRSGVVALKFRRPHDCTKDCAHAKYLTPYPTWLYNTPALDRADRTGVLAITEGEFDALILDHYCGIPAVGMPGSETYTKHPEWREIIRGYREVLIFKDNDEEITRPNGTKFRPGDVFAKQLAADIDTARIIRLPSKDVNATYLAFGAEGIREAAGL